MAWFRAVAGGVELEVRVVPRSSRTQLAGLHDDRLKVLLNAPPVDGEANAALIELLARALGVRRAAVTLVRGETGRRKCVRVVGVTAAEVSALAG